MIPPCVFINGCAISPLEYSIKQGHIVFKEAPPAGAIVDIRNSEGAALMTVGNGTTIVYKVYEPEDVALHSLVKRIQKYHKHPTIRDQLNKLEELLLLLETQ